MALALAAAIRRGERTCLAVAEEAVRRARTSKLNAFARVDAEAANRQLTDGPLRGVPLAVKDSICIKDETPTAGSRAVGSWKAREDAVAVSRLRAAGANVIGATNCDEFGMGSTGETCQRGFTRHPLDPTRAPGGSSSGSAAAVSANIVPLALGSDTGGSIRLPASWCGVVGVKPSYGRVSRRGLLAYCSSTDCVGVFARSVEDAAFALGLIAGYDDGDATSSQECVPDYLAALSIGNDRVASINVEVDDEIESVVAGASRALKADACDSLSSEFLRDCAAAYHVLAAAEAHSNLARYHVNNENPPFGAEVARRVALGKRLLGERHAEGLYERAVDVRAQARALLDDVLSSSDVLMLPVAPTAAPKLNAPPVITKEARGSLARDLRDDLPRDYANDFLTAFASLAGLPALSVPFGRTSGGLPVGVQVVGRAFDEVCVLRTARRLELIRDDALSSPARRVLLSEDD
jgi:aspartyl-tRNA(Asn)/glutamyl-tRNA(Gln) amidotransferase subunit A